MTGRNYPALFLALDDVMQAIDEGHPADDVLRRSFDGSVDGFGADRAVLLIVEPDRGRRRLRALAARGMSWSEVAAIESGLSVPGVSASCVREALDHRTPVLVQDAGLAGEEVSEVLRMRPCSVLCAPLPDPRSGDPLAVLYVQRDGVRDAFGELDRAWIEVYARALGRALAALRSPARGFIGDGL